MANTPVSNYRLSQSEKKKLKKIGKLTKKDKPTESEGIRNAIKIVEHVSFKEAQNILEEK